LWQPDSIHESRDAWEATEVDAQEYEENFMMTWRRMFGGRV
jgi:hypothetical protein